MAHFELVLGGFRPLGSLMVDPAEPTVAYNFINDYSEELREVSAFRFPNVCSHKFPSSLKRNTNLKI